MTDRQEVRLWRRTPGWVWVARRRKGTHSPGSGSLTRASSIPGSPRPQALGTGRFTATDHLKGARNSPSGAQVRRTRLGTPALHFGEVLSHTRASVSLYVRWSCSQCPEWLNGQGGFPFSSLSPQQLPNSATAADEFPTVSQSRGGGRAGAARDPRRLSGLGSCGQGSFGATRTR